MERGKVEQTQDGGTAQKFPPNKLPTPYPPPISCDLFFLFSTFLCYQTLRLYCKSRPQLNLDLFKLNLPTSN
jgi:hypothetical protein